jgi:hypothetical protein
MVQVPRRRHDQVGRAVVRGVEPGDLVAGQGLDARLGAQRLAAERVVREQRLHEPHVQHVVGRVLGHHQLVEDDVALGVHLGRPERRLGHHVGQQLQPEVELGHGQAAVVGGVLPRGEGVHLAPHGVDRHGDRPGAALLGALEQQVLEEV